MGDDSSTLASDTRNDAIDDLHEVTVIAEFDSDLFENPAAFHVSNISVVDQNVRDTRISQEVFQRAQSKYLVQKISFDLIFFRSVQGHLLRADDLLNDGRNSMNGLSPHRLKTISPDRCANSNVPDADRLSVVPGRGLPFSFPPAFWIRKD